MRLTARTGQRLALAFSLAIGACAVQSGPPVRVSRSSSIPWATTEVHAKEAEIPITHVVENSSESSAKTTETPLLTPFGTRYAYFEPASFDKLPGWQDDHLSEAWRALRQSCKALAKRSAWTALCGRSAQVDVNDEIAIRRFIEDEFVLYQVHNADRSPAGVITGYYEPLLNGSRQRGGHYVHPVYGLPEDLLFLDARSLPADYQNGGVAARVEGRHVKPVEYAAGAILYTLDTGAQQPDIRDKKIRVRIRGSRIVPYYTRAEIERDGRAQARVLAWVDNPVAAYLMQVQGSGKVRLPDGRTLRLAYADQNGHPFLPPTRPLTRSIGELEGPLVRGMALALPDPSDEIVTSEAESQDGLPMTRGVRGKPSAPTPGGNREKLTPEVAAVVEALLQSGAASASKIKDSAPVEKGRQNATSKSVPPREELSAANLPTGPASSFWSDPSYVFFREIPDSEAGPIGALGVPLTAGRSLAVDPRTTPLGFPVFISTTQPGKHERLNRLMLAQDTGGAIRGAVRADYFWGFGAAAWALASRMKESAEMWLLMPKQQDISARAMGIRTRGLSRAGDAECVIPDPELCVE